MILISPPKTRLHERRPIIIALAGAFLLAACTSTPGPTGGLKAAGQATAGADVIRVADSTSPEVARIERDDSARAEVAQTDAVDQRPEAAAIGDVYTDAQRTEDQKRQIEELQAEVTDRGLVMILGDVLFATAADEVNLGNDERLAKLAGFLNKYPGCSALIEGYTDSAGNDGYNRGLSQRRADAVRTALVNRGVASARLIATGRGEASPVSDNNSPTGRQQNRRVEVIIENTLVTSRHSCM
jgi:outer membrane protein OmpA-like peptidoglycan-associated protein